MVIGFEKIVNNLDDIYWVKSSVKSMKFNEIHTFISKQKVQIKPTVYLFSISNILKFTKIIKIF